MLKFASICPHPPIIIPTIGSPRDLEKVSKTVKAMEELSKIFQKTRPETVIIISPHGSVDYDNVTITISPTLSGDFQAFNDYKTELNFENDLEFVDVLQEKCREQKIPVRLISISRLDHGALVPLYYLAKNYVLKEGKTLKVVLIAYSFSGIKNNFNFGKKIFEVCNLTEKTRNKKTAIIASGDLSHRLTFDAPAGFSPKAAEFDEKLIDYLEADNVKKILDIDPELVKEAGECGYLSIIMLLGALSQIKAKPRILSYEAPFGVGYLVVNFAM